MRNPRLEARPRGDGTTAYRVKWWTPRPNNPDDREGRAHSLTFDDPANAQALTDALTEHGTITDALARITWPNPTPPDPTPQETP